MSRRRWLRGSPIAAVLAVALAGGSPALADGSATIEISVRNEALRAMRKGLDWLTARQAANGSWGRGYPAITALGATALLRSPLPRSDADRVATDRALRFLATQVREDGGIYPEEAPQMQAYNTAISLMALVAANDTSNAETIRGARRALIALQADEVRGYSPDSAFYGGIGYGSDGRPDLSNLQWSLEALKVSQDYAPRDEATSVAVDDAATSPGPALPSASGQGLFWDKAILFLQRCQNRSESNDRAWSKDDGGFVYHPELSKAGDYTSYGSMTYAGMKSFIHANLAPGDPRVRAAFEWCSRHWNLDENPGMGQQGLYYYFHTLAKALNVHGVDTIVDAEGRRHAWREELIVKLASFQHEDGYWKNAVGRWWENEPELVTCYVLLALEEALGQGLTSAYPAGVPR